MRIVSLLPSSTEILFAVGAGADLVGVTFECDFPPAARAIRVVSTSALPPGLTPAQIDSEVRARVAAGADLYHLDAGALTELEPDLVVTQDLCAVCAVDVGTVDAAMAHLGCRGDVLTVDPMRLDDVLASVLTIGDATGHAGQAQVVIAQLRARLALVSAAVAGRRRPRVAVLEWTAPPFSAGHWVPDLVSAAGGLPVLGAAGAQSQTVAWSAVAAADSELIVVAPCGYHLDGAAALARDVVASGVLPPRVPVWAVDADAAFVRPGPRLVDGVETLAAIFHPHAVAQRPGMAVQVAGNVSPELLRRD